jgi:hypothetical protein
MAPNRMIGRTGFDEDVRPLLVTDDWASAKAAGPDPPIRPGADRRVVAAWWADGCPRWRGEAYAACFAELDAWTEYWDTDRPETRGRFYFGDDQGTAGHLSAFLPSPSGRRPPFFERWKGYATFARSASAEDARRRFRAEMERPAVADAIVAMDRLVCDLVLRHFGDPIDVEAWLDAMERFATDTLPEDPDRFARVPAWDLRKAGSRYHTMGSEVMWFAWAAHVHASQWLSGSGDRMRPVRAILLAGVCVGVAFDFVFRGRSHSHPRYRPDDATRAELRRLGRALAGDFDAAVEEAQDLYRVHAWPDLCP